MYNPYLNLEIAELQEIAEQNWDHVHELNKIKDVFEHPKTTAGRAVLDDHDAMQFYARVLHRIDELKSMDKEQQDGRAVRLRLQAIEQLRNHAENTGVFDWFKWPTTVALMGDGTLDASGWYALGLFKYVGYHVGNDGEHVDVRRYILDCVFHNELPHVNSDEYMSEFSVPQSPQRLRKMANVLASSAVKLKSKTHANCSQAIADYESDLEYLYDKYYVGVFHFDWPQI